VTPGVGGLPVTGARLGLLAAIALALMIVGSVLVAGARRRTAFARPGSGGASHR
jgi:hypothetical protein